MVLTLVMSTATSALSASKEDTKELSIQNLFDQRAKLLNEKEVDLQRINRIESQLQTLGVESLSSGEVNAKFKVTGKITPQVSVPNQTNVSWFTYRSEIIKNGKTYEVQRLIAQPNTLDSNLKSRGSASVSSTYRWKAASINVIKMLATSSVGEIPGASTVLTVYDAVTGFISDIQPTTWIDGANVIYSWSQTTTVIFFYVKLKGETDDKQYLKFVTNKCDVVAGWQFPTFTYTNSSGGQVAKPSVVQGSRNISAIAPGYDNANKAVDYYIAGGPIITDFVNQIPVIGIEDKTIKNIVPVSPMTPVYIY